MNAELPPDGPLDEMSPFDLLPTEEQLVSVFDDMSMRADMMRGPGGGVEMMGPMILVQYPCDLHFLCGCANFDPFGHNNILRTVAFDFFRDREVKGQPCKPRACIREVLTAASRKAKVYTENDFAIFRIWKPNLEEGAPRLNERNWKQAIFEEITGNDGHLKKHLEWPLRKAIEKAQKSVAEEKVDVTNAPQPDTISQQTSDDSRPGSVSPVINTTNNENNLAPQVVPPSPSTPHSVVIPETIYSRAHPEDPRAKRNRCELSSPENKLKEFRFQYESPDIQDALSRMEKDRGDQEVEEWATALYKAFRDDLEDQRCRGLNMDRKKCLELIYDVVREWEKHDYSTEFENDIAKVFKTRNLVRILTPCLAMDRAQALYKMRNATNTSYGIPWYSQLHMENDFAFESEEEQKEWFNYIDKLPGPPPHPSMNKRLFRLLFSDVFGLRKIESFKRWSKPAKVPATAPKVESSQKNCFTAS
ncbi:hypothetical protein ACA910_021997 [Epithemia clementina (nom. ined.)]